MKLIRVSWRVVLVMAVMLTATQSYAQHVVPDQFVKWLQRPDLSPMGMDVNAHGNQWENRYVTLADDFLCGQPGPITGITLYTSWLYDCVPEEGSEAVRFHLSFHKDIPVGEIGNEYSMPGELLWEYWIEPGQFLVEPIAFNLQEGWYDPLWQWYDPFGDTICWQYSFNIDPLNAFKQFGNPDRPEVYWLDVHAVPLDPFMEAAIGWKTSIDHWNDAAVWGTGPFDDPTGGYPNPQQWNPLYHPDPDMQGMQLDMAFMLDDMMLGDYNRDGCIDQADYTIWADNYGTNVLPWSGADGNGDGTIDQADYTIWADHYGICFGMPPCDPVPEPATIVMLALGVLAMNTKRR